MNQKKLSEALENVVEDCVNNVGVYLNTAIGVIARNTYLVYRRNC
ncbi:MAG: hypothetical protein V8R84_11440 [Eubacterium sp.]